jgi:hypothetical protein
LRQVIAAHSENPTPSLSIDAQVALVAVANAAAFAAVDAALKVSGSASWTLVD